MSFSTKKKQVARARRHHRVRKLVRGTAERPRLAVFRSNKHITAQVIDDITGRTLAAASSTEADRPRLAVFRSNKHIVAQVIDDRAGRTLAAASSLEADLRSGSGNKDSAAKVGKLVAERAKAAGVSKVVFDRGGFLYHGRVAALADAAREAGLEF